MNHFVLPSNTTVILYTTIHKDKRYLLLQCIKRPLFYIQPSFFWPLDKDTFELTIERIAPRNLPK